VEQTQNHISQTNNKMHFYPLTKSVYSNVWKSYAVVTYQLPLERIYEPWKARGLCKCAWCSMVLHGWPLNHAL